MIVYVMKCNTVLSALCLLSVTMAIYLNTNNNKYVIGSIVL